ncbi:MAG: hypothetical protein IT370_37230 [Deltaproteobacteria bacterium]|nr:hypothetical protein [Deltaproteobacteria bacterium]
MPKIPRWLIVSLLLGGALALGLGWDTYTTLRDGGRARLHWFEWPVWRLGGATGVLVLYVLVAAVLAGSGVALLVLRTRRR